MDFHAKESRAGSSVAGAGDRGSIMEGVLQNLFDGLSDSDSNVRLAIQSSLAKILETHPARATDILMEHIDRHPKMSDHKVAIFLKTIEDVVSTDCPIPTEAHKKMITFVLGVLTRSTEFMRLRNSASAILVVIGRGDACKMVMEALTAHTKEGVVPHFMIMECMGTLATTNVPGVVPFIKSVLSNLLPNLGGIKSDHIKQATAFAVGRFSEALLEHSSATPVAAIESVGDGGDQISPTAAEVESLMNCATEISVAYDVFYNQWLNSREKKLCEEVLHALSPMYPLLPPEKILGQTSRLIPRVLSLYRRSIERNSVTQFLSSILKTNIALQSNALDSVADGLITDLFDRVCVYPDYEKPQTVKGHYEVLRCFNMLSSVYGTKIMDVLLIHLRNNNERDRIKSLLILTHLLNTSTVNIESKLKGFLDNLKQMVLVEKAIKMKMTLLKTIIALAQKAFIREKEFVWFIVRYSCKYTKVNQEYGSLEEHANFVLSCENSLFMLSSTVGTMDELLKRELLNYFVLLDFTDICSNLAKCLASLFAKSPNIEFDVATSDERDGEEAEEHPRPKQASNTSASHIKTGKIIVPSAETIFARCIALLGNHNNVKRASNILSFLKYYYPHLNPELGTLWNKEIPELLLCINKEPLFNEKLREFITETVQFLTKHDEHFGERLVNRMADQLLMYPITVPNNEFVIPVLNAERGMLLKAIALTLRFVSDAATVDSKIELIIGAAKQENLDKYAERSEYETKIISSAIALGYLSRAHLTPVIRKLAELAHIGGRKHSTGFFSNFIKDTHKELEVYKTNLLVIKSFGCIMDEADPLESLQNLDDTILNFLIVQLTETKDQTIMSAILRTLLSICNQIIATREKLPAHFKYRKETMEAVFKIPIDAPFNDLPLLPTILKLGTDFIRIDYDVDSAESVDGAVVFEIACKNFFSCAQYLKTKFDSQEEDDRNSFLAKHLNDSLPELNALAKVIIEADPSPSTLDLIISILECWTRDQNSEVRICSSHVFNNALDVYIKSMKIGCEAPSKFNQAGQMLGKIIPRCIDSNGTVRQVSVEILQKTLEISCIYDTLTIADGHTDWVKEIETVKKRISTDDPKLIYNLARDIANIIAARLSNFQYLQFCKTLLQCLRDPEQSSSIGASVVLKFFIQQKGSELFHAIPDLVKDSLVSISNCELTRAKSGVLKALVALTKHHPKLVCSEILLLPLPYEQNVVEYWRLLCTDTELASIILENFLQIITSSCLYEPNEGTTSNDRQKIASVQPFAIFCALREMMSCKEIKEELKNKFPQFFTMLLTSLATYTNLAAPMMLNHMHAQQQQPQHQSIDSTSNIFSSSINTKSILSSATSLSSAKSKFSFIPNKDAVKLNPCEVVLESFREFLDNLEMEQLTTVLSVHTQLAASPDLRNYIELLTPMAIGLMNQFQLASSTMKQIVTELCKYVSSPYDGQRVAAVGLFSRLVPLKPCGEISSMVLMHLSSALSDPNGVVRGLSIQGLAYVGHLTEHDIEKYTETAITALLKGIDDAISDCIINIPLESMRGLSRILQALPSDRIESFHVSLAIRIRPFFGSYSVEIREAAMILFGDLCESKMSLNDGSASPNSSTEALREQLFANFFPLLLHLSEGESTIIRACKGTLRRVCALLNSAKVNEMAQRHLIDYGQLNYNIFIVDFVKLIAMELPDHIQDFIDSCLPKLRSQWPEVRGAAAIVIGILHNFLTERNTLTESVGTKIALLLKDENPSVRAQAATALGYFFGDI